MGVSVWLVSRPSPNDHITPVLLDLHWLPIHLCIEFKIYLIMYKILNGCAPSYLCDMISTYKPSCFLRSSPQNMVEHSRAKLGRVPITKGRLDPTSRPRVDMVEPTLNRVHITTDNPRSNPLYIKLNVGSSPLAWMSLCWPRSAIFINTYSHVLSVYYCHTHFTLDVCDNQGALRVATMWVKSCSHYTIWHHDPGSRLPQLGSLDLGLGM